MSTKHKFINPEGVYFVTLTVNDWVDVFTRVEYKNILTDNLSWCQKHKGLAVFGWCIMTNHLHLIIKAKEGNTLADILRDYKKFTSKAMLKAIAENPNESRKNWLLNHFVTNTEKRFWQPGSHPIELWSNAVVKEKLNYLHQNPVNEGIVFRAEDYIYSSAPDYSGIKGILDIIFV